MPTQPLLRSLALLISAAAVACSDPAPHATIRVPAAPTAEWRLEAPATRHVTDGTRHGILFAAGEVPASATVPLPPGRAGVTRLRVHALCDGDFSLLAKVGGQASAPVRGQDTKRESRPLELTLPTPLTDATATLELVRVSAKVPVVVDVIELLEE